MGNDEVKTEKIRVMGLVREKDVKKTWLTEHAKRQAAHAEAAAAVEAECERARNADGKAPPAVPKQASAGSLDVISAKAPNALRFDLHQRQGRHQVMYGDGRARMLSKVYLNGEWIYAL